jgi:hypothetical protein
MSTSPDRPRYKIIAIVCGLFLFSAAASAERFNVFAGYSYSRFGLYLPSDRPLLAGSPAVSHSLNGWNGSLEVKVLPILGIVADSSGHYGNETTDLSCSQYTAPSCTSGNGNVTLITFTFGPQVSLRLGRFEPYAHALFGGARYRTSLYVASQHSFADVLGGGIDVSVIPRIAWRVQADALQTWFSLSPYFPNKQNSLRLSTGFVVRF